MDKKQEELTTSNIVLFSLNLLFNLLWTWLCDLINKLWWTIGRSIQIGPYSEMTSYSNNFYFKVQMCCKKKSVSKFNWSTYYNCSDVVHHQPGILHQCSHLKLYWLRRLHHLPGVDLVRDHPQHHDRPEHLALAGEGNVTNDNVNPCQISQICLVICQTYWISQVIFSIFFLIWNLLVSVVLVSVARYWKLFCLAFSFEL